MVQRSRNQRRQQRKQRGGNGSCSARFMNRQMFEQRRNQRGGMAAIDTPGLLLADATRVQAQVADLDRFISDSQTLVRQAGGSRRRQSQRQRRQSQRRQSQRQRSRSRKQRGGMNDFNAPGMLLSADQYAAAGFNREFHDFGSTMPSYSEVKGAQA